MNQSEKQPGDQELDDLLREVNVPSDLKASLRAIPQQSNLDVPRRQATSNNSSQGRMAIVLVLAATVLGFAAFFVWPLLQPNDNPIADNDGPKIIKDSADDSAESNNELYKANIELASIEEISKQALAQLEIERLESQLREMRVNYEDQIGQQEYTSIILALADQSVVELGGSQETANASMVSIIEKFPHTQGAKIARQFLDQQTN